MRVSMKYNGIPTAWHSRQVEDYNKISTGTADTAAPTAQHL
jgi:hypothetical protein